MSSLVRHGFLKRKEERSEKELKWKKEFLMVVINVSVLHHYFHSIDVSLLPHCQSLNFRPDGGLQSASPYAYASGRAPALSPWVHDRKRTTDQIIFKRGRKRGIRFINVPSILWKLSIRSVKSWNVHSRPFSHLYWFISAIMLL